MKKLLGIVVLGLLLSTNAYAKKGSGELKLSKIIMTEFLMYLYGASNPKYSMGANKKNNPLLMVVSKDGNYSLYYYCPTQRACASGNYVYKAIVKCEKDSNGSPCFLFAKKRKIVWDNGVDVKSKSRRIKRKLLKEPYKIAQIVQDLGFYDGDISELPGIDYETAELDDQKKITGKIKKKYKYETSITNSFSKEVYKGTSNNSLDEAKRYALGKCKIYEEKPELCGKVEITKKTDSKKQKAKDECKELGFTKGTEKFGDCVMKMLSM